MIEPWRTSITGVTIALRVTPRGGRDDIDGIETLANGRSVVKVRVRAIAEGGEANRAVTELLAALTANSSRPSLSSTRAPWEPRPAPVPVPPVG